MTLDIFGPAGERAALFSATRFYPAILGLRTPFGVQRLDRSTMQFLDFVTIPGQGQPGSTTFLVPSDPAVIGQSLILQALTSSPSAPSGFAWSNAVFQYIMAP